MVISDQSALPRCASVSLSRKGKETKPRDCASHWDCTISLPLLLPLLLLLLPLLPPERFAFGVIVVKRRSHVKRRCETWSGGRRTGGNQVAVDAGGGAAEVHQGGGFLPATPRKIRFSSFIVGNVSATSRQKRGLLFQGSGHARHTLLLPSCERPGGSLDE